MGVLGIVLAAAGAILYFAVNAAVQGIDLAMVGMILMVVGAIAILVSLIQGSFRSFSRRTVRHVAAPPVPPRASSAPYPDDPPMRF
jgi:hypothetical protein